MAATHPRRHNLAVLTQTMRATAKMRAAVKDGTSKEEMNQMKTLYLALITSLLGASMTNANPPVTEMEGSGVRLVTASDNDFQAQLENLKLGKSSVLSSFQRYSVILVNGSNRGIVGYALRWTRTRSDGTSSYSDVHLTIAKGISLPRINSSHSSDPCIKPGAARLISPGFSVGSGGKLPPESAAESLAGPLKKYTSSENVSVTLDAIIFDDATFIGPDSTNLTTVFQAELLAERQLKRQLILDHNAHKGSDEIFAPLQALAAKDIQPPDHLTGTKDQWYAYHEVQVARALTRIRSAAGDDAALAYASDIFKQVPRLTKRQPVGS